MVRRTEERMSGKRWVARAVLGAAFVLGAGGSAAAAGTETTTLDKGRILYLRNCAECHGLDARGDGPEAEYLTKRPANLRDARLLARYQDDEVVSWVLDGKKLRLELRPDALKAHARETEAIYAFLTKLPDVKWDRWLAGEAVFLDRCLPCHDYYGRPSSMLPPGVTKAPRDLSDPAFQASVSDAELRAKVRHGSEGMPALVPPISKREARALTTYVRLLSPGFVLYDRYCLDCHGARGEGGGGLVADARAPEIAFTRDYFAKKSEEDVKKSVWHMLRERNPSMPHFRGAISAAEVKSIVAYLRGLEAPKPEP
jgi:mono/diheme cytochrome c family protein